MLEKRGLSRAGAQPAGATAVEPASGAGSWHAQLCKDAGAAHEAAAAVPPASFPSRRQTFRPGGVLRAHVGSHLNLPPVRLHALCLPPQAVWPAARLPYCHCRRPDSPRMRAEPPTLQQLGRHRNFSARQSQPLALARPAASISARLNTDSTYSCGTRSPLWTSQLLGAARSTDAMLTLHKFLQGQIAWDTCISAAVRASRSQVGYVLAGGAATKPRQVVYCGSAPAVHCRQHVGCSCAVCIDSINAHTPLPHVVAQLARGSQVRA